MMEAEEQSFPIPFGKYLLTELIAVGGMAEVYRAKIFGASGFEKEMVVKRILPKYAQNPNFVQMLIDEAKIAVSLTHGNIVPIYELGELDGSYYIAMEYVAGRTILDVLRLCHSRQRALPWPYAFGIAAEVARGLAYAHSQKGPDGASLHLVHRDINPRNIVITAAGEVKILDFGIARASTKKHQTASGVIKGTPGYMSPEQMYARAVDHRSDLYCLGILLHELLTLKRLFPVWDVKEMRAMFEKGPVAPPSSAGVIRDPGVDAVVMKTLAERVEERFQSAGELEEALRAAIARSGTPVTSSGLSRELDAIEQDPGGGDARAVAEAEVEHSLTHTPTSHEKPLPAPVPALSPSPAPSTQPMPPPATGQAGANRPPPGEFIISLASEQRPRTQPLEPLPKTAIVPASEMAPKTQVLAQNAALAWSREIGDDAELLAIAKAMRVAPGQTRRTLLIAGAVAGVALLLLGALYGPEAIDTVDRALEGKKLRNGAVVVKTNPPGAEVILDGESRGLTNLKVTGVDPDRAHQLVVKPKGMDPMLHEIAAADFQAAEDLPTFFWVRDFVKKDDETDAGPAVVKAASDEKKTVKKKPKKKRRRRSKRQ